MKPNDAPWRAQETGTAYWNVVDRDGVMVASAVSQELAERIALARNAFQIMLDRKWVPSYVKDDFWQVEDIEGRAIMIGSGKNWWPDPFTALVEADKWYAANVERPLAGEKGAQPCNMLS